MKRNAQRPKCPGIGNQLTPLALALLSLLVSQKGWADNYFNPAFLSTDTSKVADLSRFEGNNQAPGVYRVDVYLNGTFVSSQDIAFKAADKKEAAPASSAATKNAAMQPSSGSDDSGLTPSLPVKLLDTMGVNLQVIPKLAKASPESRVNIESVIPAATTNFDFEHQRLDISIPQAALHNNARGYIPPEQWDEGVNALLMNYNFTGSNSSDHSEGDSAQNSYFLGF